MIYLEADFGRAILALVQNYDDSQKYKVVRIYERCFSAQEVVEAITRVSSLSPHIGLDADELSRSLDEKRFTISRRSQKSRAVSSTRWSPSSLRTTSRSDSPRWIPRSRLVVICFRSSWPDFALLAGARVQVLVD